jgi:Protein prenyltransferase alpha subunit repeat
MEMKLCNKMLDMDERNFHCWNYRNWLIADVENDSPAYIEREIAYT